MARQTDKISLNLQQYQQILRKIQDICSQCRIQIIAISSQFPQKINKMGKQCKYNNNNIEIYIKALSKLKQKIIQYKQLQNQYEKLQNLLQKTQTEIRKRIGIEQQFKLYIDTIRQLYDESQSNRLELLQSSKAMIKQLKMGNQKMYSKGKQCGGGELKVKQQSKKNISHLSNYKDRVKTDYSTSLQISQINNGNRFTLQSSYTSPTRQKLKRSDVKMQLTQRQQNVKKKKNQQNKKKQYQNHTVISYIGNHKKRTSKQKNNLKKILLSFSDHKKNNGIEGLKQRVHSSKKVHKSLYPLSSLNKIKDDDKRIMLTEKYKKRQHESQKKIQPMFYFSTQVNNGKHHDN